MHSSAAQIKLIESTIANVCNTGCSFEKENVSNTMNAMLARVYVCPTNTCQYSHTGYIEAVSINEDVWNGMMAITYMCIIYESKHIESHTQSHICNTTTFDIFPFTMKFDVSRDEQ